MSEPIQVCCLDDAPAKRLVLSCGSTLQANDVYFECADIPLTPSPEALVAAALLPAMSLGRPLHCYGALDADFVSAMERYQQRMATWNPSLQTVPLHGGLTGETRIPAAATGNRVGLFFSCGVDSFYSLLVNLEEVTDLIFVHGFDIAVDDQAHARLVERQIREVARQLGKRALCVRTNLRPSWLDRVGGWGPVSHGAAMAAVAHLLGPDFRRILIAGSDPSEVPWPWGSHPDTDPLWSAPNLEFVHDHREVCRADKIRRITDCETAMRHLRVCWKNRQLQLNCCRCEKCLRTMICLRALGQLEHGATFPRQISLLRVALTRLDLPVSSAVDQLENLRLLARAQGCAAIKWALRFAFFRCWLFHLFGWKRKSALKKDESARQEAFGPNRRTGVDFSGKGSRCGRARIRRIR